MIFSGDICDQLSDQAIIEKALEKTDFFSCLFLRYEARMLRYIKSMAQLSNQEAEDILQEAFIKIWKNLLHYDKSLKASSWIYRIVHNEVISAWRKKTSYGKNKTKDLDDESQQFQIPDEAAPAIDQEPSTQETINPILEKLPQKYKEILALRFIEDLSYEEISDILKIPEGTVATRLNRAKKNFASLYHKTSLEHD